MTDTAKPQTEQAAREERLAAALRQNLKRRKAQARAQLDNRDGAAKEADPDKSPLK